AELVTVLLKPNARVRKSRIDIDFSELAIKGRASRGNLVTKYTIKKIDLKEEGHSTLAPRKIWFDETVRRLNVDARGTLLGNFKGDDRILTINSNGEAKLVSFDLMNRFDDEYLVLEKWNPEQPVTCIYFDGEKGIYFNKRFLLDHTPNIQHFVPSEHPKTFMEQIITVDRAQAEIVFAKEKGKQREPETIIIDDFIAVKGIKAIGNQLTKSKVKTINITLPEPEELNPGFDEVEQNEDSVAFIDHDVPDGDFPEEGAIGSLFEE